MGSNKIISRLGPLVLGKCFPCVKSNASKFRVRSLVLDKYLNMYFPEYDFILAHDPEKVCKTGDTVLLKRLPEKLSTIIFYKVEKVIYPLGNVTDPITGKKVSFQHYWGDDEKEAQMFGALPSRFQYDKAPPRGWQEDTRDLSHRDIYKKWNEDGTDQKYAA